MNKKVILMLIVILGITLILIGILGLQDNNVISEKQVEGLNLLPIPKLLEDLNTDENIADFKLIVQEGIMNFYGDALTPTMGYNGDYLGPVMRLKRGDKVNVQVINELNEATSLHWHGLEVNGTADGGPHQVIKTNDIWEPSFVVDQPASTLWFHPHVIGTTATQVYRGLAGLIIIDDEVSRTLNLPDTYGENDIPLIIQDRSFNKDGSFDYNPDMMHGVVGENIMVNGAITPTLNVNQIKMRFRIVNGSNASNYVLQLSDRSKFHQIASDGGFLEKPFLTDHVFISPGERSEIVIDFSNFDQGDKIDLISQNNMIMHFVVQEPSEDLTIIPDDLVSIEPLNVDLVKIVRTIELDGMGHMVSLNGKTFDMNRIDYNVKLNGIEIWNITTRSSMMGGMGHPFHVHGTQFQVLSRNGNMPSENEKGWKDTVFVDIDETVTIAIRFQFEGVFMFHCHILEHEEAGMMGQLRVAP